jgi:hypothetical protein
MSNPYSQRFRHDGPGVFHHSFNVGVNHRVIFETARDCRVFKSLLAREVHAGRIEVFAYCLMLTHFHLLVRSVNGQLAEAMKRIQHSYSCYFNRTRQRCGPLFRTRFKSRWINSYRYQRTVFAYILDNPVTEGMARKRSDYEWSSAHDWKDRNPPRWLARDWVEREVNARGEGETWDDRMDNAFPGSITDEHRNWIEKQLKLCHREEHEDDSLKHCATPRVIAWTIRMANLADGTRPWRPICPVDLVERVLKKSRAAARFLRGFAQHKAVRAIALLKAGLLRMLCGCSHREIAMRTHRHRGTVSHDIMDHRERFDADKSYARLTSKLTHTALAAMGV